MIHEQTYWGKIWEKNVRKVGKMCQNEKTDWKEIPKYDKDEKWCQNMGKVERDATICNCSHVTKCDKNTKNPKNPIGF